MTRRVSAAGWFGAAVGSLVVLVGIAAPWIAPFPPFAMDLAHELQGPSARHFLGAGENGIDVLSHLIYGARISLIVGVGTVVVSGVIGTLLGAAAGYAGGILDGLLMRIVDVLLAFPGILLAIFIAAVLPPSLENVIVALAATGWVGYARLVRSQVLSLRRREFVLAAKAIGAPASRIVWRHLLPNVLGPVVVQASFALPAAILAEASLSFLGVGVPPGTPSWGALVDQGAHDLLIAPHLAFFAGLTVAITVLGFNLLGDAIRDRLDPRHTSI
jgi:peptide/nickel transport system permease protein